MHTKKPIILKKKVVKEAEVEEYNGPEPTE
jgi:hypothetical protein